MLRNLAESVAANPRVYDLIQKAVGVDVVDGRIANALLGLRVGVLLDVGAGTGLDARLRGRAERYLAIDVDRAKLDRLREKQPAAAAVLADACALPLGDASVDTILVKSVAHHLDDAALEAFLEEAARVLTPGGRLVLSDPVWAPRRVTGRILWAGDRGSHPRSEGELRSALERRFAIRSWESYAILHRYVLGVAAQGAVDVTARSRGRRSSHSPHRPTTANFSSR